MAAVLNRAEDTLELGMLPIMAALADVDGKDITQKQETQTSMGDLNVDNNKHAAARVTQLRQKTQALFLGDGRFLAVAPPARRRSALAAVKMQEDGAKQKERKRGGVAVIARPKPKAKNMSKEKVELDKNWVVLLHNDDVHTFDYVTMAVVKVVGTVTRKKAHRITMQAHSQGVAQVTMTWKQMAKTYCLKLQKFGLTSSIAPDGGGGGGGGGGYLPAHRRGTTYE